MSKNQWIITKDLITYGEATGVASFDHKKETDLPVRFHLYDDDGELYFKGRMEIEDFQPLDDFGTPGYGCTRIETARGQGIFTCL